MSCHNKLVFRDIIDILFRVFFHTTLSLMLIDWACPIKSFIGPLGVYELSFILLFACFVIKLFYDRKKNRIGIKKVFWSSKLLIAFTGAYVLYSAVTVLFANDMIFGAKKFITAAQMLVYGVILLYYCYSDSVDYKPARIKEVGFNVGISALIIALIALVGYFGDFYTSYFERVSTIVDYNQFSTILIVGLVCISVCIIKSKLSDVLRYILFIVSCVVLTAVIYAADSRRSTILVCIVGVTVIIYVAIAEFKSYFLHKDRLKTTLCLLLAAICIFSSVGVSIALHDTVGYIGKARYNDAMGKSDIDDSTKKKLLLSGNQRDLEDTINSLVTGEAVSKRTVIWNVAITEFKNSSLTEKIFGQGSGASWEIYDDPTKQELEEIYTLYSKFEGESHWMNPHNFILQDLIDGGLVQLTLLVTAIITAVIYVLILLKRSFDTAIPIGVSCVVVIITLFLSCGSGVVANKLFWLCLFSVVAERYRTRKVYEPKDSDKKNILYVMFTDEDEAGSGSSVRPKRMLDAFKKSQNNIISLSGLQNRYCERRKNVRKVIKQIKKDMPDMCYIEPPSCPVYGFADKKLIKTLCRLEIPTAVFYRDAHWLYADWWGAKGIKAFILRLMHKSDLRLFVGCCDKIYFPSESMAELFNKYPIKSVGILPPACEDVKGIHSDTTHSMMYVGGLNSAYGADDLINAFKILNDEGREYKLIFCCRKNEFDGFFRDGLNIPTVEVVHLSGDEMKEKLDACDCGIIPLKRNRYMDFSVPVKLFEYIGSGLPVISTDCVEVEKFVNKTGCGIVCQSDPQSIADAVKKFYSDEKTRVELSQRAVDAASTNRWEDRVNTIICDLSIANQE